MNPYYTTGTADKILKKILGREGINPQSVDNI